MTAPTTLTGATTALALVGPLGHDPDELRRRAGELLSRPPYVDDDQGLVSRVLGWVGDRIAEFLDGVLGEALGLPFVPWLIVSIGVVALGLVVWRVTRGLVVDRSIAEVPVEATTRSAREWHADAEAFTARGELLAAIRCRYAALVVGLVDRGTIEDLPGRTVRELDAEVAVADPGLAAAVEDAGERFQRAVYGRFPVSRDDLDRVTEVARSVSDPRRAATGAGGRA